MAVRRDLQYLFPLFLVGAAALVALLLIGQARIPSFGGLSQPLGAAISGPLYLTLNSDYSPPWNPLTSNVSDVFLSAGARTSSGDKVNVTVNASKSGMLFYQTFYIYVNTSSGPRWQPYTFKQQPIPGKRWITDRVAETVQLQKAQLPYENYALVFGCLKDGSGDWKCGCVDGDPSDCWHWSIQSFDRPAGGCVGDIPANSVLCPGAGDDLLQNMTRTLVPWCSAMKCAYACDAPLYYHNGTACALNLSQCGVGCAGRTAGQAFCNASNPTNLYRCIALAPGCLGLNVTPCAGGETCAATGSTGSCVGGTAPTVQMSCAPTAIAPATTTACTLTLTGATTGSFFIVNGTSTPNQIITWPVSITSSTCTGTVTKTCVTNPTMSLAGQYALYGMLNVSGTLYNSSPVAVTVGDAAPTVSIASCTPTTVTSGGTTTCTVTVSNPPASGTVTLKSGSATGAAISAAKDITTCTAGTGTKTCSIVSNALTAAVSIYAVFANSSTTIASPTSISVTISAAGTCTSLGSCASGCTCPDQQICTAGMCTASCQSTCSAVGTKRCVASNCPAPGGAIVTGCNRVETCTQAQAGCYQWQQTDFCSQTQTCSASATPPCQSSASPPSLSIETFTVTPASSQLVVTVRNPGSSTVTHPGGSGQGGEAICIAKKGTMAPLYCWYGPKEFPPGLSSFSFTSQMFSQMVTYFGIQDTQAALTAIVDYGAVILPAPVTKDAPASGTICFGTCGAADTCTSLSPPRFCAAASPIPQGAASTVATCPNSYTCWSCASGWQMNAARTGCECVSDGIECGTGSAATCCGGATPSCSSGVCVASNDPDANQAACLALNVSSGWFGGTGFWGSASAAGKECCGDDSGEFLQHAQSSEWSASTSTWGTPTNSNPVKRACCASSSQCTWLDGECVATNGIKAGNSEWLCQGSVWYACNDANKCASRDANYKCYHYSAGWRWNSFKATELFNNGIDDDCDPTTLDSCPAPKCSQLSGSINHCYDEGHLPFGTSLCANTVIKMCTSACAGKIATLSTNAKYICNYYESGGSDGGPFYDWGPCTGALCDGKQAC